MGHIGRGVVVAEVDEVERIVATKIPRKIETTVYKISLVVFKCLSHGIYENLENDHDSIEKVCMIVCMISLSDKKAVKYKVRYIILVMVAVVVVVLVLLTDVVVVLVLLIHVVVVLVLLTDVVVVLVLLIHVVVVLVLLGVGVVIPSIVVKTVVDLIVEIPPSLGIVRVIINAATAVASKRVARRDKSIHAGEHRQQ